MRSAPAVSLLVLAHACGSSPPARAPAPAELVAAATASVERFELGRLRAAIGDRRIVLLGENGHGVGEFTRAKVGIVRDLHEKLGFEVVVFESGFHECREANAALASRPVVSTMEDCLNYQLRHAELKPLFEYALSTRNSSRPLTIAGMDLQIQGRSSRTRPGYLRNALAAFPRLADSVAVLDSLLIEKGMQPADSLLRWVRQHGRKAKAVSDSAAALLTGDARWTALAGSELLRRELLRAEALDRNAEIPASVFEVRDEWMARSVARLLEEGAGGRKIAVWLHNDHARYGQWEQGGARVRSTGWFLRQRFPGQVFSLGFFMGQGRFANNSRQERAVPAPPGEGIERTLAKPGFAIAFLSLTNARTVQFRSWADAEHPYLRGGTVSRMRPGHEFDALLYFARVSPPSYRLR